MNNKYVFAVLCGQASKSLKVCCNKISSLNEKHELNGENSYKTQKKSRDVDNEFDESEEDALKARMQSMTSEEFNTLVLPHYYLVSQGLLIQRLSTQLVKIPESNVKIFVYGRKEEFDILHYSENKSIIQLGFEENYEYSKIVEYKPSVYVTENQIKELNFQYFQNEEDLISMISNGVKNAGAQITVFLADDGCIDNHKSLTYLQIYLSLLKSKPSSLRIYTDSQFMAYHVEKLNRFINRVNKLDLSQFKAPVYLHTLMPIFDVAAESKERTSKAFDYVDRILSLFDSVIEQNFTVEINELLAKSYKYIYNKSEYKNALFHPDQPIKDFVKSLPKISTAFNDLAECLVDTDVTTLGQYHEINSMINSFYKYIEGSNVFSAVFNKKMVSIVRAIYEVDESEDYQNFYNILKIINSQKIDGLDNLRTLYIHNDLRIFYSGFGITFPSIRIDKNCKAIIGSPVMSAFIEEVFMHSSDKPINVDDIRRIVNLGNDKPHTEFPKSDMSIKNKVIINQWIWPQINVLESPEISNDHLTTFAVAKTVDEIMHEVGYIEYELGENDKERRRYKLKDDTLFVKPHTLYYDIDSSDDYYESDDYTIKIEQPSSETDSDDEQMGVHQIITKEKIEKLQKMVSRNYTWDCNVFNIWLFRFKKVLKKRLGIDFDPSEDVEVHDGLCIKFLHTYRYISEYLPAHVLSDMYHNLSRQIEKLILDNKWYSNEIYEMIANCFDDADRVVTPIYFPGKMTYLNR